MDHNPYAAPKNASSQATDDNGARLPHEIQLRGSMSVRDVLMTQALLLRHRWFYAALTLGIYISFVLALGLLSPNGLFGSTFMVLGLIIMPAILPFTLMMIFLRLRRDANQQVGIFAATETRLSDDGIHTQMDQSDPALKWASFSRFLASEHVILLFLKDSNDHLIVARSKLVDPEDWSKLLQFLSQRYART